MHNDKPIALRGKAHGGIHILHDQFLVFTRNSHAVQAAQVFLFKNVIDKMIAGKSKTSIFSNLCGNDF